MLATPLPGFDRPSVQSYERTPDGQLARRITLRSGAEVTTTLSEGPTSGALDPASAFDLAWLRSVEAPATIVNANVLRSVDLFAGCGGLSIGMAEAARSVGMDLWPVLANDLEPEILGVYAANFPEAEIVCAPIETLLDSPVGSKASKTEREFARRVGEVDIVIGGPPCQGHSNLNNHTRNDDPKNALYMRMARFCEVVRPQSVVIENVPGVLNDKQRVAQRTWDHLIDLGYTLDSAVIDASDIGVAQRRKRSVTVASLDLVPDLARAVTDVKVPPRPVSWAISGLGDLHDGSIFDTAPSPTETNAARIDYLFDQSTYELPDELRPDCHRLKDHSYVSVYGRLYPDRPAPTITTGFGTMGRGRFVHPTERRMITPHEAARIQFFPDFFDFGMATRTLLQKVIGNAVPPKMGYAIGVHLFR